GLAGIASLVETARAEARAQDRACLLLDNGDLFQGNTMGAFLAGAEEVTGDHPVVRTMDEMGYDAIGTGNHDLDFGPAYLRKLSARLKMPMVASNLAGVDCGLQRAALLRSTLPGLEESLLVGVLSVLPSETAQWNRHVMGPSAEVEPSVRCLERAIPELRAQGAQIIVVLAHMGITQDRIDQADSALALAGVPGIDALIAGHTHLRFPGRDHLAQAGVFPGKGQVLDVPAIMPGHAGSDLGVLDLTLRRDAGQGWRVIGHVSSLRKNTAAVPAQPAVAAAVEPAHTALRAHLAVPLGQTRQVLHNFFATATPTQTGRLTARAEALTVKAALAGQAGADVPLLAATSAHSAGGRDGPDHFLCIPEGVVLRRHLAGLSPFSNELWVLRLTGADIARRLEHSLSAYSQLSASGCPRPLLRPDVPAFNYETIHGLDYQIDLKAPSGRRLVELRYQGAPLAPNQSFLLVTNQFRAAGGGGFEPVDPGDVVLRLPGIEEARFSEALRCSDGALGWDAPMPWRFCAAQGLFAELRTSPLAEAHLEDIAHLSPQIRGLRDDGFLSIEIAL
ncbi:MAG: 5'-nucleotidase C-terminal domain-containing protein, partial [Pseudomonadota bacterium]